MPKISIIIPVYNAEQYLRECLDSVVNQTLKDIEIICVNDGSTDNSLSILEEYARTDSRIKIINKENGGVHTARNLGIDEAKGDYTIFLDADDFFDLRMFEKLYNKALETGCDIVACETYDYDDATKKVSNHHSLRFSALPKYKKIFSWKDMFTLNVINPAPWNKIIKTDFLKKTGLRFCKLGPYEDIAFFYSLYAYAKSITYIEDILVYYRLNIQNQRSSLNYKSFYDLCNVFENVIENCSKLEYFDEIKRHIAVAAVDVFIWNIKEVIPHNSKNYPEYYNRLHEIFNSEFYSGLNIQHFDGNYYLFSNFEKIKRYDYSSLNKKDILETLFSLKNNENYQKVLTILGFKIYMPHKKPVQSTFKKIFNIENIENKKIYTFLGLKFNVKNKYLELKKQVTNLRYDIEKLYEKEKVSLSISDNLFLALQCEIKDNTVLLVEVNDGHSETLPGYVKYFLDLGYNVDLIINPELNTEKPFVRFKFQNFRIFELTQKLFARYLTFDKINSYKKIFISSHIVYDETGWHNCLELFSSLNKYQDKLFCVEHHLDRLNEKLATEHKVFQIAEIPGFIDRVPMLNPHYFGDINITSNNLSETSFIVVGWIAGFRRNYDLLINAVQQLHEKGVTNFKITHIGRKGSLENIPKHLKKYFNMKGYQYFDVLFDDMEKADYILALLDSSNPQHERYIKYGTSGTFQYSYGFLKPCIIHKKFASIHKFNEGNSLLFACDGDLALAMERAIDMNQKDYINMQNNLLALSKKIYEKSLINLKNAFDVEEKI